MAEKGQKNSKIAMLTCRLVDGESQRQPRSLFMLIMITLAVFSHTNIHHHCWAFFSRASFIMANLLVFVSLCSLAVSFLLDLKSKENPWNIAN